MKLHELLLERELESLKLRTDNPGGSWLEGKRKQSLEDGENAWGAPARFGTVTAVWSRAVLLPVDLLAKVKGVNAEQRRVRDDDLKWLVDYMSKNKKLPQFRPDSQSKQYFPFIMIYQDGTPWVNEGNHRIMSAKQLGWKSMPIELRYFNGGELESGVFSPEKVRHYDAEAIKNGFDPSDEFVATKD